MGVRIGVVGVWSIGWALLSGWLFDPEAHLNRGPTVFSDDRLAESTRTAVALGALLGGVGGVVALRAARSSPWWAWAVAVAVGALASGGSQGIHEWRYPVGEGPGQPGQPAWVRCAMLSVVGAFVGLPVGCAFTAVGEAARRFEGKVRPVSGPGAGRAEPTAAALTDARVEALRRRGG